MTKAAVDDGTGTGAASERIAAHLRAAILAGEIGPGDRKSVV